LSSKAPQEFSGRRRGPRINQRRGIILGSTQARTTFGTVASKAEVPLAEMFGYSTDLRSATQGKAEFSMEFKKYTPVPRNVQEELIKKYADRRKIEQD
jgi:elongation factor G